MYIMRVKKIRITIQTITLFSQIKKNINQNINLQETRTYLI